MPSHQFTADLHGDKTIRAQHTIRPTAVDALSKAAEAGPIH